VPTHPLRDMLQQAEAELTAGRPGEALRRCNEVLAAWPRWLDAQRMAAEAHLALGELDDAERLIDAILAAHPEHVRAYCDRAYLAQLRGDQAGALACYRRACELAPADEQLRAIYQRLASQLGRPGFTPSHTGLARLLVRSELYMHALREWDVALAANPRRLDAQIGMAETLWRMGDTRRAENVCRYIVRAMPDCLKPTLLLAFAELSAGHEEEAKRLVQAATQLDPEHTVAGELFGDLVAVGNTALADLFRNSFRAVTSPLTASAQQPTASAMTQAPSATSPLFARPTSQRMPSSPPADASPAKPPANGSHASVEDFFSRSRASAMPDGFEHVFHETEYMLWSRDQEEASTAEIPTPSRESVKHAEPAPETGQSIAIDEDADMRFVRWLQAQGARPIDPVMPLAPEPVPAAAPSSEPAAPPQQDDRVSDQITEASPDLPDQEEPNTIELATIESDPTAIIRPEPATAELPIAPAPEASSGSIPEPAPIIEEVPPEPIVIIESKPAASDVQTADVPEGAVMQPTYDPSGQAPLTIEAIEQGLVSAGFSHHETGRLASMIALSDQSPSEIAPEAADATARLESARALRRAGRMGEALADYRVLVKSDAEHLDEVIRDLRDAAIEDPHEPEIFRLLGDASIRRGDYVEALEAYNRASALRQQA
jgi:tetratricopeptide (TPR) repeat protein